MVLKNVTKNTIVTNDLVEAKSFINKYLGLLRKSNSRSLMFKARFGIHTFGLRKAIDVIILDNKFSVVKFKENLKPNSVFFWNPIYNLVIELPSETLKKTQTTLGCYLKLKLI